MIVRSAAPVSLPVAFDSGFPDGSIQITVYDETGAALTSFSVTPAAGDVSALIQVPSLINTLAAGRYLGYRDVVYTYTVDLTVVTDEIRYSLEGRLPYGVSPDGVRSKLGGIDPVDLPDSDIELVPAFLSFQATATPAVLAAASGDLQLAAIKDAIEALAGMALIPTMAVRVGAKESNGTNSFSRQLIDWTAVYTSLSGIVDGALVDLIPGYSITLNDLPLFIIASPSVDAITNS